MPQDLELKSSGLKKKTKNHLLCTEYTFLFHVPFPGLDLMTSPVQVHQMQGDRDRAGEKVTLLLLHRKHLDTYIPCY